MPSNLDLEIILLQPVDDSSDAGTVQIALPFSYAVVRSSHI